jgi:hypothetical protein
MIDQESLLYVILPGKSPPEFPYFEHYNLAYEHWKATWKRTFARRGKPEYFNAYDFLRQDFVSTVFYRDEVVSQNLSTFFYIENPVTHDSLYFSSFNELAGDFFKAHEINKILSIEYISVNPKYSNRRSGWHFSDIVVGLGLELVKHFGADATTGMPRRIAGIDEIGRRYGYRTIGSNISKAGLGLDLAVALRDEIKLHPDPKTRELIRDLWQRRFDTTDRTLPLLEKHPSQ